MKTDLQILFPGRDIPVVTYGSEVLEGTTIASASEETIHVAPFFFGEYPQAVKLMKPLADILNKSGIMRFKQQDKQVTFALADDWPMKLPEIMAEGGEVLMSFLAFAIKKPRKWFDTLMGDDGISIVQAVFEENAIFFKLRILPLLQRAGLMNPTETTGEPLSPVSSEQTTAEEKSTAIH